MDNIPAADQNTHNNRLTHQKGKTPRLPSPDAIAFSRGRGIGNDDSRTDQPLTMAMDSADKSLLLLNVSTPHLHFTVAADSSGEQACTRVAHCCLAVSMVL